MTGQTAPRTTEDDARSRASDCSTSTSKVVPIRAFLDSLDEKEYQLAYDAIGSFLDAFYRFPKPAGIERVNMTETELERYHDGWNAAKEAAFFTASLVFRQTEEFIKWAEGK